MISFGTRTRVKANGISVSLELVTMTPTWSRGESFNRVEVVQEACEENSMKS